MVYKNYPIVDTDAMPNHSFLFLSEQKNPIVDTDVKSDVIILVHWCLILVVLSSKKNFYTLKKIQLKIVWRTSGIYSENISVQVSCKKSDDIIRGQLINNCSIELSEINESDGDIFETLDNTAGECTTFSSNDTKDQFEPYFQDVSDQPMLEQLELLPDNTSKSSIRLHQIVLALSSPAESFAKSNDASCRKGGVEVKSSTMCGDKNCPSPGVRLMKNSATKVRREYTLRSFAGESQSPKSSIQDKAATSEPDSAVDDASDGRKRGRRQKHRNCKSHDEFSRMRTHLKYLLHRMRYEQNLIEAYSSEGWRGQSLEKLRPEKELERAKSDINRSKLKIRSLFQRIDAICAEGEFPESLFDSEGLIDSEDIFCAKCGSKDLSRDNDIILCDGACDRGFHQKCLDPPLRTEDIPPGDQGWLCPACDCKLDCIQLLNDSLETKYSISDSWEIVFPEAAKAEKALDDVSGLPSDDSEDDEYNPDGADDDMVGDESTSDESDFSSASEDLGAIQNNDEQYLGLPSDDSEDDDYNPNSVDSEEQPKQECSSSDFTSASEDLNAISDDDDDVSSKDGCEVSLSELVQDLDDSMPVSGRRRAERLDYKKLYDETYGNGSTDSSDDEEWKDAAAPKRRKNGRENTSPGLSEGEEQKDDAAPKRRRYDSRKASSLNASSDFPVDAGGISNVVGDTTNKAPLSPKAGVSKTPETSGGKTRSFKRLGEEVTRSLHVSFKENRYPDRSTKDKLAAELGLTLTQVNKWFGNARWSSNHPPAAPVASPSGAVSKEVDKSPDLDET